MYFSKTLCIIFLIIIQTATIQDQPAHCDTTNKSDCTDNYKKTIWLDCDPGLDDAIALIYAGKSRAINLLGVSTSAGNTNLQSTTRNTLDILYNIQREDVPVVRGSPNLIYGKQKNAEEIHGEGGLGGVKLPRSDKVPIT